MLKKKNKKGIKTLFSSYIYIGHIGSVDVFVS